MPLWREWKCELDAINAHKSFHRNQVMEVGNCRCRVNRVTDEIKSETIVLDIGCNDGQFGKYLIQKKHCKVYGIDCSEACHSSAVKSGIIFTLGLAEKLPYENDLFDYVIMMETLEHIWDTDKVLKEVYRVLQNNGSLLGSVPHPDIEDPNGEDYHCNYYSKESLNKSLSNIFDEVLIDDIVGLSGRNQHLFFKGKKL